jgi:peptidyl-prolyl cis-trans isomerase A (cyclophilin A)
MPQHARRTVITIAALALTLAGGACARAGSAAPAAAATAPATDLATPVDSFLVRFTTTKGEFDVMLRAHWAPVGVARVRELAAANYFDGARFFRALRGFVIQFGLAADTAVTEAWRLRTIQDDTVRESNRRGTLVFAAGGANTRTAQLFINLRDNPRLDAMGFAPLGEVVRGIDVVDALHTEYARILGGPQPDQRAITREGEAYLAREFPLLDAIRTARIVRTWPARR